MTEELSPSAPIVIGVASKDIPGIAVPSENPTAAPEVHPTKSFIDAFLSGGPLFVNKLKEHLVSLWHEFNQVTAERDALITKFGDKAKAVIEEVRAAAEKI